jgi:Pseudouridylate synthases, 23S RNA-specific
LVVNKPSGLLSVPGRLAENHDSVHSRLQQQYADIHIAHRLDLDTSGLMVLAKGKDALRELNWQFERRETYKEYTAVVYGLMSSDCGEIDLPLICDWPNRPKQKVCHDTGKSAKTHYTVLARHPDRQQTRVLLKPITGRSHQLRVHMTALGHPISGCDFYAHDAALKQSPRLLLHASLLRFKDPASKQIVEVSAKADF